MIARAYWERESSRTVPPPPTFRTQEIGVAVIPSFMWDGPG
jgi:hypothetical protein